MAGPPRRDLPLFPAEGEHHVGRADLRSGYRHQSARRSGRRCRFRLSRRRGPADLRFAVQAERAAPHPGAPGGRRGARRRRLCPLDRQGRRRAGDERPRRDQRRDRPDRRADGFGPDRLPDRAGADPPDRQRRVSGSRYDRHHAALHQAQLSGQGCRRPRPHLARGVLRREERPARPGRRRSAEGRAVRARRLHRARSRRQHKSYRPQTRPDPARDRRGGRADRGGEAAAVLWRRRADQFRPRGLRPLYRIRAAGRCALHPDPDGARRVAGERPAFPRHGRHARHVRGEHGDARLRPDDRGRLALRRPGDRTAQRLLAEFEEDPHRHRPVLDQQERAGRRAAARRLRRGAGGAARRLAQGGAADRRRRAQRLVAADRCLAGARLPALRPLAQRHHQAAIRAGAALCADPRPRPRTSRPRSASTRCGRRSSSSSRSPTAG